LEDEMKKGAGAKKKLEIKKEKVRPLTDEDLDNVAGGAGTSSGTSRALVQQGGTRGPGDQTQQVLMSAIRNSVNSVPPSR